MKADWCGLFLELSARAPFWSARKGVLRSALDPCGALSLSGSPHGARFPVGRPGRTRRVQLRSGDAQGCRDGPRWMRTGHVDRNEPGLRVHVWPWRVRARGASPGSPAHDFRGRHRRSVGQKTERDRSFDTFLSGMSEIFPRAEPSRSDEWADSQRRSSEIRKDRFRVGKSRVARWDRDQRALCVTIEHPRQGTAVHCPQQDRVYFPDNMQLRL